MTINEVYLLNRYTKPLLNEIERLTKENEQLKSKVMACEELIRDLEEIIKNNS